MTAIADMLSGKRILLIIGGGIAAYKSLDLVRRLKERGCAVRAVMTRAGEQGLGRMAEPLEIVAAVEDLLNAAGSPKPLAGRRVIVTSGPTHEPIDPVRYMANRSSGKQGHAIARAAAAAGADVILVTGPVGLPDPIGVKTVKVETARDMLAAVEAALPADVGVFAAAV